MGEDVRTQTRINVLDEHTANRIAAGEVVERPASVVKELVENALDANATSVSVVIEEGGKKLVKVTDNGVGMGREDAVLSLQRHATSKIAEADDLDAIGTLGFRGEALPSIASVSVFEVTTREEHSQEGVSLRAEAGTIVDLQPVGAPQGTTISVHELFYNTPARLKFTKTVQTELAHITDIVSKYAMAYPEVHFRLVHNEREVFNSPASDKMLNAITAVCGRDVARNLVEVEHSTPAARVYGYVSNASLTRSNRKDQTFFVNGRPIRNRTMTHALEHAYRGVIPHGRYPFGVLVIDIAPELVDVNVHPAKSEVKFSNEREMHSILYAAVNSAISGGAAVPEVKPSISTPFIGERRREDFRPTSETNMPVQKDFGKGFSEDVDLTDFKKALEERMRETNAGHTEKPHEPYVFERGQGVPAEESPVEDVDFHGLKSVSLTNVKVIGQARDMYIVAQCDDGVLIIDQHVAHERVLYDAMVKQAEESEVALQKLILPVTVSFGARDATLLLHKLDDLRSVGYELEPFGGDTFIMRAAPASLAPDKAEHVLKEIVSELVEESVTKHLVVKRDKVLVTASCKLAIKAGQRISHQEAEKLITNLMRSGNPFVCPHGRPIILSLSNWELDRKFRRI